MNARIRLEADSSKKKRLYAGLWRDWPQFAELHDYFVPDVRDTLRSLGVHEATPEQVKRNQKKMIEKLGAGDSRFQTEWDANFWSSKP